jgi:L-lactate dehydrogenase complex protein LldG
MESGKSKTDILQSIRKHKTGFPDVAIEVFVQSPLSGLLRAELSDVFKKSLQTAGADIVELKKDAVRDYIISTWDDALDFAQPEIAAKYPANCPLSELNMIEHAVMRGNFGVAENGTIWLEDKDLSHRIIPFITQHLVLKLDADKIVPTMQEAYRQIYLKDTGFGVFISGPSKTADIEQSLVYGAHGAKELTVLLIDGE